MKKLVQQNLIRILLLCLASGLYASNKTDTAPQLKTASTVNTTTTIKWTFGLGTSGQVATYDTGISDYFNQDYVEIGSNLAYKDYRAVNNITYTRFQPAVQASAASDANVVKFNIRPKKGMSLSPDSISFDATRYGTDGGYIDVAWESSDGTITTVKTAIKPIRDNAITGTPHVCIDLSSLSIGASTGDCAVLIYIYGLGNTKQAGLANIHVDGKLSGDPISVTTHTLATSVSPAGAGSIASNPSGTVFDDGDNIILTLTTNFGFKFSHWENAAKQSVSTANPLTVTLTSDSTLTAVFDSVKTYSLNYSTTGGGKKYMISASPSGTTVNSQTMYETGTNVTLTASSNPIMTFTNWGTGETSADLSTTMTENKSFVANYSAKDYIVGWDFYNTGSSSRAADFYSTDDNQTSSLILRDATGTLASWLDKSIVSASGYVGKGAAVNWNALTSKYYYQISFNATDFENISVLSSMLYNYNAYSEQQIQYSLDGTTFVPLDTISMSAANTWYENTVSLPSAANHASKVYIRWIPNYDSAIVGTTATNDGTSISGIYVFGTEKAENDPIAPVLISSIPAENGTGASATGKVVLTFDKKIQIAAGTTATLGSKTLTPAVSGKTITFPYAALDYNNSYTFTLLGNTVSNLSGVAKTEDIVIHFTTMTRPAVTKKVFNFVVGVDGDFKAALAAAGTASSSGNRFYIFFPNGEYNIGENTGDANQMTTITTPKLSLIGQDDNSVIVYNKSTQESINSTATMYFTNASTGNYMQDISLMNKMDYRTGTLVGRGVALWDQGTKNIYKYVKLLSNQDTYYTGGSIRSYLEDCEIHGTVDFICGGGDIYFNECLLYLEERSGNCITAPATTTDWGYVFSNCTIDGFSINNNAYRLGRPWQNSPRAVYLNTTMKQLPAAAGWGDMGTVPALFAEYNSMSPSGAAIDLSNRKTSYTYGSTTTTVSYNPVLTTAEAAQYTVGNMLGGSDAWQPQLYTDQAAAPVINGNGQSITWDDNDYVLCWGIFKNNVFVQFVTTNSYSIPSDVTSGIYTVRAANEMGGLSPVSNSYDYASSGIVSSTGNVTILSTTYYDLGGRVLKSINNYKGVVIARSVYSNGEIQTQKIIRKGF